MTIENFIQQVVLRNIIRKVAGRKCFRKMILVLLLLLTAVLLGGCGSSKMKGEAEDVGDEIVELDFYIMNTKPQDQERIMEKANAIIEEEIGARLNLICIEKPMYADKMNLMINAREDWDLCMTANWGGINFYENAVKGAYADLTDLIAEYAPQTYSRIPEGLWEGVKVNGRIYAFVNYQQWGVATMKGFRFRSDIAGDVGFDWQEVKGKPTLEALEMIGPFLGKALEKHPDMIGWETSYAASLFAGEPLLWDMEPVGDQSVPGWVRYEEPGQVINQFETEEFEKFCQIMRDWYEKGYVRRDGATIKNTYDYRKAARYVAEVVNSWPDCVDFPKGKSYEKMSMCYVDNAPAVTVSTTRLMIPAGAGSTAATAVNAYSPNIEKAVQLIELLNTNDELYLLLTAGEEGIDYVYDEQGYYHIQEDKYNFNYCEWQLAQSYSPDFTRVLYNRNEAGEVQKAALRMAYEMDFQAPVSPLTGFEFDPSAVKVEIADCAQAILEMMPALSAGSEDPQKVLPEFLSRLKAAGVDVIIGEKQRQLDHWMGSRTEGDAG